MDTPTFFTALLAGILTFLSPCILPLLPGYLSFISGKTLSELTVSSAYNARIRAIFGAIAFGAGFTIIFVLLGATATALGSALAEYKFILSRIAGVLIIIFGLHMMGVFKISILLKQVKFNVKRSGMPFYIEAFILGVAFVLGWTPCVGPILSAVLAIAANEESVATGMQLLLVYSLGLWIPFLIAAIAISSAMAFTRRFSRFVIWAERISGLLLILVGLLLVTDNMTRITVILLKAFPFLSSF